MKVGSFGVFVGNMELLVQLIVPLWHTEVSFAKSGTPSIVFHEILRHILPLVISIGSIVIFVRCLSA